MQVSGDVISTGGNVQDDGRNQYLYDAEGRICAVHDKTSGVAQPNTEYVYNADGTRVAKGYLSSWPGIGSACPAPASGNFTLTRQYLLDSGADQVTELNGSGTWQHSNAFQGGHLTATYDTAGLHYSIADPLGTKRVQFSLTASGSAQLDEKCKSLPFGNDLGNPRQASCSGTVADATEHHFTGKERDAESGNDYFSARYYASSMGRFMSPDPLPWIHWQNGSKNDREKFAVYIANPQNFDLYAYVLNNPLSKTDPTGMYVCTAGKEQCQAVQNSLDAVKRAADALSKGNATEQALGKKLNGVLDFYGKAGVDNGVKVGFSDLGGKAWGQTSTSFFTGKTSITFDNHAFNQGYAFGAETAAHEGAHGVDKITSFGMMFWGNVQGTEAHAYEAEAAVDRGLGTATASDGKSPVWDPGWGAAAGTNGANAINANATSNAHADCGGGCFGEPQN